MFDITKTCLNRAPKLITSRWLKQFGACLPVRKEFRKAYPKGVELTRKLLVELSKHEIFKNKTDWVTTNLLNNKAYDEYYRHELLLNDEKLDAYNKARNEHHMGVISYDKYYHKVNCLYNRYYKKCWLILIKILGLK